MKIKVLEDHQGLVKDQIIENMCPISAGYLIETGIAVNLDAAVVEDAPKPVTDKPPHKCNRKELEAIVAHEGVDIGEANTNALIAGKIVEHRETVAALEKMHELCTELGIEGHEDMTAEGMQLALAQKEFDNNFGDRTECDDTCEFAAGEDCTRPDGVMCQLDKPDAE